MIPSTWRALLAAALLSVAGHAAALEPPKGVPVLTLTGQISHTNQGKSAVFDDAMLARLPQKTLHVHAPWYPTPQTFEGPLLRDVLDAAGASGKALNLTALNDYVVAIPSDDATRYDVIVARRLNGKPMSVREKGPLFVMYPFDSNPELRQAEYYRRCAWQLNRIEVE
ncbi:hypothetical protein SAMN02745857_00070 [Andreprevotia lacus DSM 23236]|jgi:hypothetical protein|uniref:Oxidoreductase molybdopterin-binding domain-containing protein n=1 Tax=Andreprevotia lacus DSM 23236 TaxID=1121001 RepID=A0A1W1WWQ3_9NEIS|nr:molybdopterin-dependent oxidoreductase [Andreprevotia lacus]SMC16000.1 hypothetical protein SAMN02745857_00070 [Andreprevotia lacus DSM 23236]